MLSSSFGLWHLIRSRARTRTGEEALARWLLALASVDEICSRHSAVADLRTRLNLREDLALLGEDVRSKVHPDTLAAWAEAAPVLESGPARAAAFILAVVWLSSIVAWFGWGWWGLALASSAVNFLFGSRFKTRVEQIAPELYTGTGSAADTAARAMPSTEAMAKDLAVLSTVLELLEREEFLSPILLELQLALKCSKNRKAKNFFDQLAPSYQKQFIGWIAVVKRPETKERRLRESLSLLEQGKKLGMK